MVEMNILFRPGRNASPFSKIYLRTCMLPVCHRWQSKHHNKCPLLSPSPASVISIALVETALQLVVKQPPPKRAVDLVERPKQPPTCQWTSVKAGEILAWKVSWKVHAEGWRETGLRGWVDQSKSVWDKQRWYMPNLNLLPRPDPSAWIELVQVQVIPYQFLGLTQK